MLLLSCVLLSPPAAAAWQPPALPVASSRGLAAPMMALGGRANLPPAALEVSNRFKKRYEPKQLEPIWRALRQCYGSEELVLQIMCEHAAQPLAWMIGGTYERASGEAREADARRQREVAREMAKRRSSSKSRDHGVRVPPRQLSAERAPSPQCQMQPLCASQGDGATPGLARAIGAPRRADLHSALRR